jgi:hypothetical protein
VSLRRDKKSQDVPHYEIMMEGFNLYPHYVIPALARLIVDTTKQSTEVIAWVFPMGQMIWTVGHLVCDISNR